MTELSGGQRLNLHEHTMAQLHDIAAAMGLQHAPQLTRTSLEMRIRLLYDLMEAEERRQADSVAAGGAPRLGTPPTLVLVKG